MTTKLDYKKQYKDLYLPPKKPMLARIPTMKFFMLDGEGDPNEAAFSEATQALYSLAYTLKMLPKNGIVPDGYYDYTVFPLEGVWDAKNKPLNHYIIDKSKLIYSLMIRQPDFVTDGLAEEVIRLTMKKKPNALLERVRFGSVDDGLCVQMMHLGSYDDEPESFAAIEQFCADNDCRRTSGQHREIYLSDPRRTEPAKLRTVLRCQVERNHSPA